MQSNDEKIVLAPTDLSNFLSCRHLSRRDLDAARGEVERPVRFGPVIDELRERGIAHEKRYLAHLEDQGLSISKPMEESEASSVERTLAEMRKGVDVIYQAALADENWSGKADFLRKVDLPSALGDYSYEVIDTKLARDTRAGTILQLCVYSYLLEKLQDVRPRSMYVVTPASDFEPIEYRIDNYAAYFRLLERGIDAFIGKPAETYPDLCTHCDFCAWWAECEARRREDDHLCYVAGITSGQIEELRQQGIGSLAALAGLEEVPKPGRGSQQALTRARDQARVQQTGRETGQPYHELKSPGEEDFGLRMLPEPTPDDIFLDFEGNHFTEAGVQEYLLGYVQRAQNGDEIYTPFWARTLAEEKQAFETFIDLAMEARAKNPGAHIYHFGAYEPAAFKRLMGRFATREIELDQLLRGKAFVDLHTAVRRSLLASVERYSIKDLEPFFGYARKQDLHEAGMSRRLVEHMIEAGDLDEGFEAHQKIVEDYNREDCESTQKLRDWLEDLRTGLIEQGNDLPRPEPGEGEASEEIGELDAMLQDLRDRLLDGIPLEATDRTPEQQARFALAHMMEFHRREDKAGWWEYFRLLELAEEDYADERRAVAGLEFIEEVTAGTAPVQRYHFPVQELDARRGDALYDGTSAPFGSVADVDYGNQTIDIKKRKDTADWHASALVMHNRVDAKELRNSLMRLGESVLENGFAGQVPYRAGLELLLRESSPLRNEHDVLQNENETVLDAASRLMLQLDGHVLPIQGPPGTGKTYTGAHLICALVQAGLKVGVTAVSHQVIVNLLEGAMKEAQQQGLNLREFHKQSGTYEGEWGIVRKNTYPPLIKGLEAGEINVLGATAWCWSREEFAQSVDVLIIDEAGQMSLSNALAIAPAGRGLVLLGDPQQLEQPLQSSHPEGSEVSALAHLLDDEETMPPDKGLFLDETYRLHPEIARFTSEAYYSGRLKSRPGLENQAIIMEGEAPEYLQGSGLRYLPVEHEGNQARSLEEAQAIREVVDQLLEKGIWQDKEQQRQKLTEQDILVIAPYNAQVAALVEALPKLVGRIGTVDRFQGQEAPVVVYSMTSSSPEDAPRGMEFLYNRNRFNVATSRALALCVLVGTPALFEPECKTPRQMKMANGFCRYIELSE